MDFAVLGPLEVRHAGVALPLGGPRQRAVLATLLLRANQVVTAQYLAEAVWEAPPARPESNIRTYVAGIRRRLRCAGEADSRLITEAGGYLLRVFPGELDLEAFRRLTDQARRAHAAADFARVAKHCQEALRLWRGKPLEGLPLGPHLMAELVRLEERRFTAVEQQAEARLALGDNDGVIGELRRLVVQHPLRESLWAWLMLALYGSGRAAEALQAFQDVRKVLRDELGTEPGDELHDLHQRILRRDVAASPRDQGTEQIAVPRQLPSDVPGFAGRATELSRLDAVLAAAGEQPTAVAVCAVSGTAGVGKTTLAVHWAHRVAYRFPDGQLYADLRGFDPAGSPVEPAVTLGFFLEALGVPPKRLPAHLDGKVSLYRSLLAGKRVMVVLDNARDAAQVRPLLPGSPGCLVVVTSRTDLSALVASAGADQISLETLTDDEARGVLTRRIGSDRVRSEPDAVDEIITRCAGLPLALAVVAARAVAYPGRPLAMLAADLRETAGSLDMFEGLDAVTDVRAVLSWSYRTLSTPAALLFRLLGLPAGPDITVPAAASLVGAAPTQARRLLRELTGAHLIGEHRPGRYAMHDLLRAYAAELAATIDTDAVRRTAVQRVVDHYLHTAHAADRLLEPHRDPLLLASVPPDVVRTDIADVQQAMSWFRDERRCLLAAAEQAADLGAYRHAYALPWALVTFLDRQGHWHDLLSTQQTALSAARRLADRDAEARAHRFIGNALCRLGRDAAATDHFQRALTLYVERGDLVGQARTHRALCWSAGQRGRDAEALHHSTCALELFRAAGHGSGEATALNAVGWYHAMLGDHRLALAHCEQALELHRQLGSRDGEASTLDSIGFIHYHLGDHQQAIYRYEQALAIHRELGDRNGELEALTHLGDAHHAADDQPAARVAWQQALEVLDRITHVDAAYIRAKLRTAQAATLHRIAAG